METTSPKLTQYREQMLCYSPACFSCLLLRQVYDNLGRSSWCDPSKCGSSDSSAPTFCWETLWRTSGSPKPLFLCRETFQRATGALTALPLPIRSFVVTAAFSAVLTLKLPSTLLALGSVFLGTNEAGLAPSTWRDMEYFHTPHSTGLLNKHFRGTLVQHG